MPKSPQNTDAEREVRLLSSALFFTASSALPKGIKVRDLPSLVRGMVEEHAPLPIEQTSWGFLYDPKGAKNPGVFYYAAARDLAFPEDRNASMNLEPMAILPALAALNGLRFSSPTWIFLLESDCLTAAYFERHHTIPSKAVSRFLPNGSKEEETIASLKARLVESKVNANTDEVLEDWYRISETSNKGNQILFNLEVYSSRKKEWKGWKKTHLDKMMIERSADVRNRELLLEQVEQRSAGKKIFQVAAVLLLGIAVMAIMELLQYRQSLQARELSALAIEQQEKMDRLQEIESMAQSLGGILTRTFEPYQWLMILNEDRPEAISYTTFTMDNEGGIRINGEAPGVQIINEFVEVLNNHPKLSTASVSNMDSGNEGVRFLLNITTGDIKAEAAVVETTASTTEEVSVAEPNDDSAEEITE